MCKIFNCSKFNNSKWFGIFYLLIIIVFAAFYLLLPSNSFGNNQITGFVDALYYSIVTITTLGFGDISPVTVLAKFITCAEVLLGVIAIGLFLNSIATEQAETVNSDSKKRQENEQKTQANAKILRHLPLVYPKIRPFLRECHEVVTPIDKHSTIEGDILSYSFVWEFNDMHDLYSNTLMITNPLSSSRIENYFRTEHELCDELKYLNSNTDLQLYPNLQNLIHKVLNECSIFSFEPAILDAKNIISQDGKCTPLTVTVREMIKEYKGDLTIRSCNLVNAYIALHMHLKILIPATQEIAKIMVDIMRENGCSTEQ